MLESTVSSCSETIPGLPHTTDAAPPLHCQGSPPASCGQRPAPAHAARNNDTPWKRHRETPHPAHSQLTKGRTLGTCTAPRKPARPDGLLTGCTLRAETTNHTAGPKRARSATTTGGTLRNSRATNPADKSRLTSVNMCWSSSSSSSTDVCSHT
eukprot:UN5123